MGRLIEGQREEELGLKGCESSFFRLAWPTATLGNQDYWLGLLESQFPPKSENISYATRYLRIKCTKVFGRLRHEDCCTFKTSLNKITRPCLKKLQ